jgi:nicotinamidase-related amidase
MGEVLSLSGLSRRTLHLCVDMQRLFSSEGPWPTPWLGRTLPKIQQIAERFPEQTIFTRFMPPMRAEDMPGQWRAYYRSWSEVTREHIDPRLLDLMPQLAALAPPAIVLDKPVYSPFGGWRLPAVIRERHADTLVVTGAETDICVLATVLGAVDLGYRVIVVSDAICSSSDAGHEALLTLFRERFSHHVVVAGAEEVLSAWNNPRRERERAALRVLARSEQ